jgi:2-polyprenyl-3-methyl-5-hydroxy-6-metoxy-1,4-benzoquinol methylase
MDNDFREIHVWSSETFELSELEQSFLGKYSETLDDGDSILDIGCGQGKLVKALSERGFKALGVDLNQESVEAALSIGLPVVCMDAVAAISKYKDEYNVFSMLDFVEHIPIDILIEILKEISSRPGAKVWIQTPNLESIMGIKFYFNVPSHITPLNPFILRQLLSRTNLEMILEWTDYGGLRWIGFRRWLTLKIINALIGSPMASLFLGGANVCIYARVKD